MPAKKPDKSTAKKRTTKKKATRKKRSEPRKRLTDKEQALVEVIKANPGMPISRAAVEAGYSESYAISGIYPQKFGEKGKLREFFIEECERQGVGMSELVRVHREALDANVVLSVVPSKNNKEQPGNTGKAGKAGSGSLEFIEAPDHKTRLKAAQSIAKLSGLEKQTLDIGIAVTGRIETVERRKAAAMRIRAGVEVVIVSEEDGDE